MKQRSEQISGQKRGFSLIELLIVICIIAIMTVIAVANYAAVERQARVEFATDTLVSTLREVQVLARSGNLVMAESAVSAEQKPVLQCYAVKIVTGTDEDKAGLFTSPTNYISVQGDTVDTCQTVAGPEFWRKSQVFTGKVILLGGGEEKVYYFKPPFGQILEDQQGDLIKPASQIITFTVGDVDSPDMNRQVEFDLSTGAVRRI